MTRPFILRNLAHLTLAFSIVLSPAISALAQTPSLKEKVVLNGTAGGGGGGTLINTFKVGALKARNKMAKITRLTSDGIIDDAVQNFYLKKRTAWIQALNTLATIPDKVQESKEEFIEDGIPVAAMTLPLEKPEYVALSTPYLKKSFGFNAQNAFGLAIHEAGHFLNPTRQEHAYFDQVAVLLFDQELASTPLKENYHFKLPSYTYQGVVSSDGKTLKLLNDRYTTTRIDLESEERDEQGKAIFLNQDLVFVDNANGSYTLRAELTGSEKTFAVREKIEEASILADGKTLMMLAADGTVIYRNIKTGAEERAKIPAWTHRGRASVSPDGLLAAQFADKKTVIRNIKTDDVVDLFRQGGSGHRVDFDAQGEKVFASYWLGTNYELGTPSNENYVSVIRDLKKGESEILKDYYFHGVSPDLRRAIFLGTVSNTGKLLRLDIDSNQRREIAIPSRMKSAKVIVGDAARVILTDDEGHHLILNLDTEKIESSIDHSKRTSREGNPGFNVDAYSTSQGHAIVTRAHGEAWVSFVKLK